LLAVVILAAIASAAPIKPGPKETPQQRLAGTWQLKSDDGRTGALILHEEGRLIATASDDNELPPFEGKWSLISENGDIYVLEFGPGGADEQSNYRVTIVLTCPNAFTLTETIKNGVPLRESHRFARIGPAR
jgi:hypothetical protein